MTPKKFWYRDRISKFIKRVFSPYWWRFIILVFTDPKLDYLDQYIQRKNSLNLRKPQPHYAWETMMWLQNNKNKICTVIEWGAGNSTLWYQDYGAKVWTIEHDPIWAKRLSKYIQKDKVNLLLCETIEEYICPSVPFTSADLVVIDGVYRNQCVSTLLKILHKSGIDRQLFVLFDDAQRSEYSEAINLLKKECSYWEVFSGPVWVDLDHITLLFVLSDRNQDL